MAITAAIRMETHPVNTAGLNGIINGNWERLEAIFLPIAGFTNGAQIGWVAGATYKFGLRAALAAITYTATPALDFNGAMTQTLALTGNATFTTSTRTAGARVTILIAADASIRNLTWPAGWKWLGAAAPATIGANKTARLELISTTTADTGVIAVWTVEP